MSGQIQQYKGTQMSLEAELKQRSQSKCELCTSDSDLGVYEVPPSDGSADKAILVCGTCKGQIENTDSADENHWRCLNDSMWSEVPAVQVMAWRMLKILNQQDLAEQIYFEEETQKWAQAGLPDENTVPTKDSNGVKLSEGDDVTIIKDLDVKGAGFTAKRGTLVKNIRLTDNPLHIEGRVTGVKIVLVAAYLKKVN